MDAKEDLFHAASADLIHHIHYQTVIGVSAFHLSAETNNLCSQPRSIAGASPVRRGGFFTLAKTHRGGQAQIRKGIVVPKKINPPCPL